MDDMRYLADTLILLWALSDDSRLSPEHHAILDSKDEVFVSVASLWEINIKRSMGKLQARKNLTNTLIRAGFRLLEITPEHAEGIGELPFYHTDPFDRMLIAQARTEKLTIMTVNKEFEAYNVLLV